MVIICQVSNEPTDNDEETKSHSPSCYRKICLLN